jgi:hypothetical protein
MLLRGYMHTAILCGDLGRGDIIDHVMVGSALCVFELALDAEGFCSCGRRGGDQSPSVAGRSDIPF